MGPDFTNSNGYSGRSEEWSYCYDVHRQHFLDYSEQVYGADRLIGQEEDPRITSMHRILADSCLRPEATFERSDLVGGLADCCSDEGRNALTALTLAVESGADRCALPIRVVNHGYSRGLAPAYGKLQQTEIVASFANFVGVFTSREAKFPKIVLLADPRAFQLLMQSALERVEEVGRLKGRGDRTATPLPEHELPSVVVSLLLQEIYRQNDIWVSSNFFEHADRHDQKGELFLQGISDLVFHEARSIFEVAVTGCFVKPEGLVLVPSEEQIEQRHTLRISHNRFNVVEVESLTPFHEEPLRKSA